MDDSSPVLSGTSSYFVPDPRQVVSPGDTASRHSCQVRCTLSFILNLIFMMIIAHYSLVVVAAV